MKVFHITDFRSTKKVYNKGKHILYLFLNDLFLERFEKFLAILI